MPIGILDIDQKFFQDLRDNGTLIKAADFDIQFNNIAAFINNELLPTLNSTIGTVTGIIGSENTFLRNVGDGTTEWALIGNAVIPDFSLEFKKLAKTLASYSILASGADQIFTEIPNGNNDEVLMSRVGDTPIWRKVQTADIEDRTITGNKLARNVITLEHMLPNVLVNTLAPGRIVNNNFANQALTNPKITRNSLETRNFGIIPIPDAAKPKFQNKIKTSNIKPGSIPISKIKDGLVYLTHFNKVRYITANKIAPLTITDALLQALDVTPMGSSERLSVGYFPANAISPLYGQLSTISLKNDVFDLGYFEPTVAQAALAKGATG